MTGETNRIDNFAIRNIYFRGKKTICVIICIIDIILLLLLLQ